MATFRLHLDKRIPLKDDKYNLSVRMVNGNDVMYLKIVPMTEIQYNLTFIRKSMDPGVVSFRNDCQEFLEKCEQTFLTLKPFDKKLFRELVYKDDVIQDPEPVEKSYRLKTLITNFVKKNETIKLKTKDMYMSTINFMEDYKKGITLLDITLLGARLTWADLRKAELLKANLSDANLSGADLRQAKIIEADLTRAKFSSADLRDANLNGSDLREADLYYADLSGADLIGAHLKGAKLTGAKLTGAKR